MEKADKIQGVMDRVNWEFIENSMKNYRYGELPKLYLTQKQSDIANENSLVKDNKVQTMYGWQEVVITQTLK